MLAAFGVGGDLWGGVGVSGGVVGKGVGRGGVERALVPLWVEGIGVLCLSMVTERRM